MKIDNIKDLKKLEDFLEIQIIFVIRYNFKNYLIIKINYLNFLDCEDKYKEKIEMGVEKIKQYLKEDSDFIMEKENIEYNLLELSNILEQKLEKLSFLDSEIINKDIHDNGKTFKLEHNILDVIILRYLVEFFHFSTKVKVVFHEESIKFEFVGIKKKDFSKIIDNVNDKKNIAINLINRYLRRNNITVDLLEQDIFGLKFSF